MIDLSDAALNNPDPCVDLPDAPAPGPYQPAPGECWRVGRKVARNLYRVTPEIPYGEYIGVVDTSELAGQVVESVNHLLLGTGWEWRYGIRLVRPDGSTKVEMCDSRDDAEQEQERALAGRSDPRSEVRLVRRLVTFGPVEEVPEDA